MQRILVIFFLSLAISLLAYGDEHVKQANVSGQFYPAQPDQLSKMLDIFYAAAKIEPSPKNIEVIISPHAGYPYSGAVAAYGYKAASQSHYRTIVILALSHFTDFEGFALWPTGGFETPLGQVPVDSEFCQILLTKDARVKNISQAFEHEHSLEVELPFLQKTFKDFKIVPLLTGRPNLEDCKTLAAALNEMIGNRTDVLFLVSSDMSHYFPEQTAHQMDAQALANIKELDSDQFWNQCLLRKTEMCGFVGVETALLYAKLRNLKRVDVLKYATSGDVTGERDKVVGYSSIVFYKEGEEDMEKKDNGISLLTSEQKKKLMRIAQETIRAYIQKGEIPKFDEKDPRLSLKEGAFVTIHKHGQLRGCIGNIIGEGSLYLTVRSMAIAAATQDPRFSPVTKDELNDLELEISVLSQPQRIKDVEKVQMGVHGVIVSHGFHHGVFLPQVATETGWSREEFLSQLCSQKAGLPSDAWKDPQTTLEIFTAQVFSEKDVEQK